MKLGLGFRLVRVGTGRFRVQGSRVHLISNQKSSRSLNPKPRLLFQGSSMLVNAKCHQHLKDDSSERLWSTHPPPIGVGV